MTFSTPEESIFYAALNLSDEHARADYISSACGADSLLKERVESLLMAYGDGEFLESPIAVLGETAMLPLIGEKPGDMIGPYKLLEQIGEGGMGLVFMAEQTHPLRRRVALKIIKPGLDTRAVIARFEAERQALALMDHPNIARVYDAGATESSRPYFVMELVRGLPITEYCHERNATLSERLKLIVEVCNAVQHAHQRGIIHRDLKPTNILISQSDTNSVPKVIDFGVAKATAQPLTERTLFTAFSHIVGTPLYMSPEQADLGNQDIDTRSDVYSLGVVLYELLTGSTPFDAERLRSVSMDEMRRIICEEEPAKPSTSAATNAEAVSTVSTKPRPLRQVAVSALRGDLDWIVMKSLEKDRRRRYDSPAALAADINRHLYDEPIEAYPPTRVYQFVKFARRNRIALLTTGAVVGALLVGLGASIWQALRATRAEQSAIAALDQSRRAVDDMYTSVAEKWLENQGTLTAVQRELLEKALQFYTVLSDQSAATPEDRSEMMQALLRMAKIERRLGNYADAEKTCRRMIGAGTRLIEKYPEHDDLRVNRINARSELALLYFDSARVDDAVKQANLAVAEVAQLRNVKGTSVADQEQLAKMMSEVSRVLNITNYRGPAHETIRLALNQWQSLVTEFPANFDYRYGFSLAKARLGTQQMWWGSTDDKAERTLREADELLTDLLKERPKDVASRRTLSSIVLTNLTAVLSWKKRPAEAVEIGRRNVEFCRTLAKEFPEDESDQEALLASLSNFAASLREAKQEKPGEVLRLYTEAHEIAKQLADRYPKNVNHKKAFLQTLIEISRGLYVQDKRQEALAFHRDSLPKLANILETPGNDWNMGLACDCLSLHAALEIEFSNYATGADLLSRYPIKQFNASLANPLQQKGNEFESDLVRDYEAQAIVLLKPAALYDHCVSLAIQDARLSPADQAEACDSYGALAHKFREQGMRAVDAWVDVLETRGSLGGLRANLHGESLIDEMLLFSRDSRTPVAWRAAQADACRLMVKELVKKAVTNLAHDPAQYPVAQLLLAAPNELRDDELALKMAQKAAALAPDDNEAQITLGWALCRVAKWQDCIDLLSKYRDEGSGRSNSLLAIAHWQLDHKNEARRSLEQAGIDLTQYKQVVNDRLARGIDTIPRASMVQRLYDEAGNLLADTPTNSSKESD